MATTSVTTKTVVIADDTAFVRDRFRTAVENAGHKAIAVKSAAELLARVRADLNQIERRSRSLAQIDDAITNLRAAVVDAYDHLPAILGIAHAHAGAKRKCPVSRSQIVHVETLTARRALSVKARPIP